MRITSNMMSGKFLRNLNTSMRDMDHLRDKVATGRSFFKASQDPIGAIKAYKLRREFRDTEMYQDNIRDVDSFLTTAESNLMGVSNNLESVYTSYLKGINGTMSKEDREIVAKELENLQSSILTTLNSKFEDKYIFGGTSTSELPFTLDGNGDLMYKGISVNTKDPDELIKLNELMGEKMYIDLGMGLKFDGDELNKDTVFDMSMSGIKFMDFGHTATGIPKNIYSLIGEIKDQLRDPDFSIDKMQPYLDTFEEQKKNVLINVTDVGSKTNYIDFLKLRTEDYQFNLNAKILAVEYVKPEVAIMNFKMQEYSYQAALSMGTKILQQSFIDFMR